MTDQFAIRLFRWLPFYHQRAAEEVIAQRESATILAHQIAEQQRIIAARLISLRSQIIQLRKDGDE